MVTSVNGKYGTPGNNQVLPQEVNEFCCAEEAFTCLSQEASRSKVLEHLIRVKLCMYMAIILRSL